MRSPFPGVEPLGLGTPFIESLSSFLHRTANQYAYPPSMLFSQYLLPGVRKHGHWKCCTSELFRLHAQSMNGAGHVADLALAQARKITGKGGLGQLSCVNVRNLDVKADDLLGKRKRWCPECWREDDRREGRYERKLWALSVVEVCPLHCAVLVERCRGCGQKQPVLARDVRVGTCAHCGRDLCSGTTRVAKDSGSDGERQLWYAEQAASFLLGCDTCSAFGINDDELVAARTRAFEDLECRLLLGLGSDHFSVRQVRAWRKRPGRIRLELLFSVLWEIRWPVASFFPLPVMEVLQAAHDGFSSIDGTV